MSDLPKETRLVICCNCGTRFKAYSCFGPHFCGESKECDDAARDHYQAEREAAHEEVDERYGEY